MQLKNRRIIVSGGARGIGASTVKAYVAEGAQVAVMDVADEEGQAVVAVANVAGPGHAYYWHCDVASRAETDAAVDTAVAALGGLDVLVNVAGAERTQPAGMIDDDHWDLMMQVNARGTMNTNQAAFRHLRDKGGQILNFGSIAGVRGMANGAAYAASKGAVLAWTRTVAQEWARYGITANALAPAIWTPMYEAHRARMSAAELAVHDAAMRMRVLIGGRLGDPDSDMAPVMIFLASPGSHFITGQTLPVDGGMMMMT